MTASALPEAAARVNGDDGTPGFGVYIHWPFCAAKCPYCDFNSHVRHQPVDQPRFVEAFRREMETMRGWTGPRAVTSVFIGGGTPSLMQPETVGAMLDAADRLWGLSAGIEITMEANPSSADAKRFAGYRSVGVNRLSLGVQALNDADLKFLGRLHNAEEALRAIAMARATFPRLSFDLIYARPGQTLESWETELRRAAGYAADHLSLYQLTIEPATRFATDVRRGVFEPLDDDNAADLFALTRDMASAAGLPAYEISNHATPGQESRHNLTYWRYQDYIGIGPGAHGRRQDIATVRHKKPENYLSAVKAQGDGIAEARDLDRREQASEALLMGLRLAEGVDLTAFALTPAALVDDAKLALYRDLGLLWSEAERIGVTPQGMPLLDALLGELVQADLVAS